MEFYIRKKQDMKRVGLSRSGLLCYNVRNKKHQERKAYHVNS